MRILVACECSNTVSKEFRKRGHYVMSCDLQANDEDSTFHYQGSVFDILNDGWDMMIAHPPCTYISKAGARWMHKGGAICQERLSKAMEAKDFFMKLYNAPIEKIAIENPQPLKIVGLPKPTTFVQPFEFGHPYSKKTLLWLKNLPPLMPTELIGNYKPFLPSNTGGKKRGQVFRFKSISQKDSSKTFCGIARAMADQWSDLVSTSI